MAGPVALFLTENIVEAIGLTVGVADLAGAGETPTGVHGIPLGTPYIEIERFSLSQSRVVALTNHEPIVRVPLVVERSGLHSSRWSARWPIRSCRAA